MRRALLGIAAACALTALGFALGRSIGEPGLDARRYGEGRHAAVQAHLDDASPSFMFLAGDSQAELQSPSQRPCGFESVNGGVAGASAAVYAAFLETLAFPRPARAALLAIGTNDILAKNAPRAPAALDRFEAAAERVVRGLAARSERVVVAALPPIGRDLADRLDAGAVGPYSERLRALCARVGCRFTDPYADLRDGAGGFAKPGAMSNGLHLAAYRPALAAAEPVLCAGAAR